MSVLLVLYEETGSSVSRVVGGHIVGGGDEAKELVSHDPEHHWSSLPLGAVRVANDCSELYFLAKQIKLNFTKHGFNDYY